MKGVANPSHTPIIYDNPAPSSFICGYLWWSTDLCPQTAAIQATQAEMKIQQQIQREAAELNKVSMLW